MSDIQKLTALLDNSTQEQMVQLMFEKDQPFGKEVMDIVRKLSVAKVHIPTTIGAFKFQPIWSFGKLTYVVSIHDKELHKELKSTHRHMWAEKLKPVLEEHFTYSDGYDAGLKIYDHMDGNYPALKIFDPLARLYFKIKAAGREITNSELMENKFDTTLKRVKIALFAINKFDI